MYKKLYSCGYAYVGIFYMTCFISRNRMSFEISIYIYRLIQQKRTCLGQQDTRKARHEANGEMFCLVSFHLEEGSEMEFGSYLRRRQCLRSYDHTQIRVIGILEENLSL